MRSYTALPPGDALPSAAHLRDLARFGGFVFEGGLLIALPISVALLCVNISLGVLTRAAPQLNIFAIGLPVSVLAAMAMLALAFPALVELMTAIVGRSLDIAQRLAG